MKLFIKNPKKEKTTAFLLSLLVHSILILILILIKIEYSHTKERNYSVVSFIEIKPEENNTPEKKKSEKSVGDFARIQKKEQVKVKKQKGEEQLKTAADTASLKKLIDTTSDSSKLYITKKQLVDTTYRSLKFAATLLDSFLLRHPEYSKYILEQQAKELVENKNIKKFSRLALEQRINRELDKYLKEHYPEGSEHEINPYTGPGLNIPIDDLIDAIKKIF